MTHGLETHQRIYNDVTGDYINIGPDADGLDMIEIAHVEDGKMSSNRVVVTDEQLPLLIQALQEIRRGKTADPS